MSEKDSYLYIITDGVNTKIGVSDNPKKRLLQLQTGSSQKLSIFKQYSVSRKNKFKLEKECHKKVRSLYEKRGEWFRKSDPQIIAFIVTQIHEEIELGIRH